MNSDVSKEKNVFRGRSHLFLMLFCVYGKEKEVIKKLA